LTFSLAIGAFTPGAQADSVSCDSTSCSTAVSISMQKTDIPASDLIYRGQMLTPDQAWSLEKSPGVDLSLLNPDSTTDVWKDASSEKTGAALDQALPIQASDTEDFMGISSDANGLFEFNVQTEPNGWGAPAQMLTLLAAKDLHAYLIKKEILRMLGYQIPAMKYLPQVSVRFADAATESIFLSMMASDVLGNITRWQLPAATGADPLVVTFQDMVAIDSTAQIPNLVFGAPTTGNALPLPPETSRTLRALALVYGLTDIQESMNATGWGVGQVQSGAYTFTVPTAANFSCSLDDALWILRRIAALTRADFTQAVASSHFPSAIAQVAVEKLIARRNSLVDAFQAVLTPKISDLPANTAISIPPAVVNGKVVQQQWPGYASQFAYDDLPSPLRDIWYYPLATLESDAIGSIVNLANSKIPSLSASSDITHHTSSLLNKAIAQYSSTGLVQKVGFGAWTGPLASGSINLSRDIVIGNYMGTTNLISLADTFGFNASAGFMVGFDGIPANLALQSIIQGTLSVNFTHIVPLDKNIDGIKDAVTYPIQKLLVAWLVQKSSSLLQTVSNVQKQPNQTPDQLKAALQNDMNQLAQYLGVGESLILTASVQGTESVSLSATEPVSISPSGTITGGANQLVISRIRIFRQSDQTIAVYVDGGKLAGLSLSFGLSLGYEFSFPVLSFGTQITKGTTQSNIYSISINPDPTANPNIYANALALSSLFRTGSSELLQKQQTPSTLSTQFTDQSGSFQFLFFQGQSLKQNGQIHVNLPAGLPLPGGQTLPQGVSEDFLALSDGTQSGNNFDQFATTIGTYIVQRLTGSNIAAIAAPNSTDPGQTPYGNSTTRNVTLQAGLKPNLDQPMVQVEHRWEGWQMSAADAQALNNTLSQQYGFKVFPDGFLMDAPSINIYDLSLKINFYPAAIQSILNISSDQMDFMMAGLSSKYNCSGPVQRGADNQRNSIMCTAIRNFSSGYYNYHQGIKNPVDMGKAYLQLISGLEQFMDFPSITKLLSDPQHQIYVYATLSGLRKSTENASTPINSNTYGTNNGPGVIDELDTILGIDNGEMNAQWVRNWL
jgi:hypothetical protein